MLILSLSFLGYAPVAIRDSQNTMYTIDLIYLLAMINFVVSKHFKIY